MSLEECRCKIYLSLCYIFLTVVSLKQGKIDFYWEYCLSSVKEVGNFNQ